MFQVEHKKVLVTGSSQGIGWEVASMFAKMGASVFIHGSKQEKTEKAAKMLGLGAIPVCADLAKEGVAQRIHEATGDVDILVLNASVQFRKAWDEITPEEEETQMHVNFRSPLELIQAYVPGMQKKQWGRIITIGSVQQYVPHKDMVVYAASKEAQYSMVKNLAKQLGKDNITLNNVSPGVIATPRNEEKLADKKYYDQIIKGIPLGCVGSPSACNGVVLLLASNAGAYITGADIRVDGGMSLK